MLGDIDWWRGTESQVKNTLVNFSRLFLRSEDLRMPQMSVLTKLCTP